MQFYKLTDQQTAAILAALRAYQNVQQHEPLAPEITLIATDSGQIEPLDDDGIDALCEYLNTSGDSRAVECITFAEGIADHIRYGEEPGLIWEGDADAIDTSNWCIERAREILGLPLRSAEEEARAEDERKDKEEAA